MRDIIGVDFTKGEVDIMTRRELEDLLYQLCPEQKKRKQKQFAGLSVYDERNIIKMMLDFKIDDWQEFLEKLAFYLKRYNVVGCNGINISLPAILQQALFYVCFMCKFEGLRIDKVCLGQSEKQTRDKYYIPVPKKIGGIEKTFFSVKGYDLSNDGSVIQNGKKVGIMCRKFADKDIINFLEIYSVNLSHNFFSRLKYRSVEKYYKEFKAMYDNVEITAPINYAGKKKDNLAIGIANLVFQAGDYDVYCDVFGGSGTASSVIPHYSNRKYVYNELNIMIYIYFRAMSNRVMAEKTVDTLSKMKPAIFLGDINWKDDNTVTITTKNVFPNVDIDGIYATEAGIYNKKNSSYNRLYKFWNIEVNKPITIPDDVMIHIMYSYDEDYRSKSNEEVCKGFRDNFYDIIKKVFFDQKIPKEGYLISASVGKVEFYDYLIARQQYNIGAFYSYYIYLYKDISETKTWLENTPVTDDIIAALYIFRMSCIMNASFKETFNNMWGSYEWDTISLATKKRLLMKFKEFMENKHNDIIEMNKVVNGTITEYGQAIRVIDKYTLIEGKTLNPLFYVDSPYIGTRDYSSKIENNLDIFKVDDMSDLIEKLFNSGGKFIFSCRLVNKFSGEKKTVVDLNRLLGKATFLKFLDTFYSDNTYENKSNEIKQDKRKKHIPIPNDLGQSYKLYVMATVPKTKTLEEVLKEAKKLIDTEIFITNYKITPFTKDGYKYEVYEFEQVLGLFLKYVFIGE